MRALKLRQLMSVEQVIATALGANLHHLQYVKKVEDIVQFLVRHVSTSHKHSATDQGLRNDYPWMNLPRSGRHKLASTTLLSGFYPSCVSSHGSLATFKICWRDWRGIFSPTSWLTCYTASSRAGMMLLEIPRLPFVLTAACSLPAR